MQAFYNYWGGIVDGLRINFVKYGISKNAHFEAHVSSLRMIILK